MIEQPGARADLGSLADRRHQHRDGPARPSSTASAASPTCCSRTRSRASSCAAPASACSREYLVSENVDAVLTTKRREMQEFVRTRRAADPRRARRRHRGAGGQRPGAGAAAPGRRAQRLPGGAERQRRPRARRVRGARLQGAGRWPRRRARRSGASRRRAPSSTAGSRSRRGEAERFQALAREHDRAPAVTEQRLYLETLERILPRVETYVDRAGQRRQGEPPGDAMRRSRRGARVGVARMGGGGARRSRCASSRRSNRSRCWCASVAGDRAPRSRCWCRPGASPHSFEPQPSDMASLAGAALLVEVGGGLDAWVRALAARGVAAAAARRRCSRARSSTRSRRPTPHGGAERRGASPRPARLARSAARARRAAAGARRAPRRARPRRCAPATRRAPASAQARARPRSTPRSARRSPGAARASSRSTRRGATSRSATGSRRWA